MCFERNHIEVLPSLIRQTLQAKIGGRRRLVEPVLFLKALGRVEISEVIRVHFDQDVS